MTRKHAKPDIVLCGRCSYYGRKTEDPTPMSEVVALDVKKIAAGRATVFILTCILYSHFDFVLGDGEVYCFGADAYKNQLGIQNVTKTKELLKIETLHDIRDIFIGSDHSFAIDGNRVVYGWGGNEAGQLGHLDSIMQSAAPIPVLTSMGADYFSMGAYSTIARANGKYYQFGHNGGYGNTIKTTEPTLIPDLPDNVSKVTCGSFHYLALTSDGKLFSSGINFYGQLGVDHRIPLLQPKPIPFFISKHVDNAWAACAHSLALCNGVLYGWGSNSEYDGELGLQGATEVYLAPTVIPITNVKQIFNNSISLHTFVLKESNECIAFGSNEYYQCGFRGQGPERVILQNPFKIVDYVTLGYNFSIMVLKDAHSSIPLLEVPAISVRVLEFCVANATELLELSLVSPALYATVFVTEQKSKKSITFEKTGIVTNNQYSRTANLWKRLVLECWPDFDPESNVKDWYLVYRRRHEALKKFTKNAPTTVDKLFDAPLGCPLPYEKVQEIAIEIMDTKQKVYQCQTCSKSVYHCETADEVRHHATLGNCITMFMSTQQPSMYMTKAPPTPLIPPPVLGLPPPRHLWNTTTDRPAAPAPDMPAAPSGLPTLPTDNEYDLPSPVTPPQPSDDEFDFLPPVPVLGMPPPPPLWTHIAEKPEDLPQAPPAKK